MTFVSGLKTFLCDTTKEDISERKNRPLMLRALQFEFLPMLFEY